MGKPRLIILIRHAQSQGNIDRRIHQVIPDHRVKLTDEGWRQAEDAGRRLRHLLKPSDTLQVFTSPYRRTRETTEGILRTLTSPDLDSAPSPFSRSKIKVYEEPRLREQDFGNFQPGSAEMEKMWKERADYGHFFYRIPHGESAADAYDRVSGFNESLWRQFGEPEFPSVAVMVTHGLMTRVFLMKWYHWSVEYFEDLRNVNHCEFVVMKKDEGSGKYGLETALRTWSELKRQRREKEEEGRKDPIRRNTLSSFLEQPVRQPQRQEKTEEVRKEGGDHPGDEPPGQTEQLPPAAKSTQQPAQNESDDHALAHQEPTIPPPANADGASDSPHPLPAPPSSIPRHLLSHNHEVSRSGDATPHEMPSDSEDDDSNPSTSYFPNNASSHPRAMASAMRKIPERKPTPEDIERWTHESGMGEGKQADALGDEPAPEDGDGEAPDQDAANGIEKAMLDKEERRDKSLMGSVY